MSIESLSLVDAQRIVTRAVAEAQRLGIAIAVVITDRGGHPLALARMDTVSYLLAHVATRKAQTACALGAPTDALFRLSQTDPIFAQAMTSNPDLDLLPGGLPILQAGQVVAGLGISGGREQQDHTVGTAALQG